MWFAPVKVQAVVCVSKDMSCGLPLLRSKILSVFLNYNMWFTFGQVQNGVCVSKLQGQLVVCLHPGPNINCCLCF